METPTTSINKKSPIMEQLYNIVGSDGWVSKDSIEPYLEEQRGRFYGTAAAVLRPNSANELSDIIRICAKNKIGVVPQGGNTGLVGGSVPSPFGDQILLNMGRMNRIRELDQSSLTITAEAGCILANLQAAAKKANCLFPLSLGAEGSCQIGGNLATNAGGVHVLGYGTTRMLTLGLEVVLPNGNVWNGLRSIIKDNSGYDLKQLFVGSEGTLGIITAATLKLFPSPKQTVTIFIAISSIQLALSAMSTLQEMTGNRMVACEVLSDKSLKLCTKHFHELRKPFQTLHPWSLLMEFHDGESTNLQDTVESSLGRLLKDGVILDAIVAQSSLQASEFWKIRESIPEAQKLEGASIKHDISVPPSKMEEFTRKATKKIDEFQSGVRVIAFGHLGDGNLHFNLTQPINSDPNSFIEKWDDFSKIVHSIAMDMGGSISAEHGIGLAKLSELGRLYSEEEVGLMRSIKRAIDPNGIMNPGKLLDVSNS